MPKYKRASGQEYDIPQDQVENFLATYPDAVQITDEIQKPVTEGKTNDTVETGAPAVSETGPAPEILVLDSEDISLDLPKIDNSEKAIKKRRKQNAKQDAIIDAAKPIELEEVVVTGVQPLEREALEYIGSDIFAGGTPTERLRQHQKLQQYIQKKEAVRLMCLN